METKKFNKKWWKPIRDRKPSKRQGTFFFFGLPFCRLIHTLHPWGISKKSKEMKEWNLEEIHSMAFQSSCSAQVVGGWHIGSRCHWPELATWKCWGRANTVFVRQTGENKSHQ